MYFIWFYSFVTSARQLIQCKADPNTANEHGNTPLHYACFWGQDEVAEVQENTPTDPVFCWLKPPLHLTSDLCLLKDLVASGAQVCICNRYGQTPLDKAKPHLRQLLQGSTHHTHIYCCVTWIYIWNLCWRICLFSIEKAEKLGQSMTKVPYKETFWKGTMRTRPRE